MYEQDKTTNFSQGEVKGQITLKKKTDLFGNVVYQIYDHTYTCIDTTRDHDEALLKFYTACKNFEANGGEKVEVLAVFPKEKQE